MVSQADFNAIFNAPLPDPREMCLSQGKAFVCVGDGEPEHIRIELPDGTIERKRNATGSIRRILPEGWIEQVASRALSHSPGHSPDLIRPNVPWMLAVIGANGAGKSTWCKHFSSVLPDPFFDADHIAQELGSYDNPGDQRRAREIVDCGIEDCLAARRPFGLETTYSGSSRPRLIEKAQAEGYAVQGLFIGTVSAEINMARVKCRVAAQTGHSVPDSEIRRRWKASQDNLVRTANSFIRVRLLDNSWGRWIESGELADAALSREAPEKWTAPFLGIVRDKDDNIVEPEGFPKWTEEQKKVVLENIEYFRSIAPSKEE